MPQHLGDDLGIDVPAEKERRARVPEVVEAYRRHTCTLKERPATAGDEVAVQRFTYLGSEY
jgi:hypothetical protein